MIFFIFSSFLALLMASQALAAESEVSITPAPLRFTSVSGDERKFEAHHWIKDNYVGGIKEFSLYSANPEEKISMVSEGHAFIDENDLKGELEIEKEDFGFLHLDYKEFSRFYDNTGGAYRRFTTFKSANVDRELELEIGHLALEVGLDLGKLPDTVFFYEREFKDGIKSRLTWAGVTEGSIIRYIAPAFQEIEEVVDIFGLRMEQKIQGFDVKGEQKWEISKSELMREERWRSTTAAAADRKIRNQIQEPQARFMSTTLEAERWSKDEKKFGGVAYRYVHLNNQEMENIFEMNENRVVTNFANPKQIRNARADNDYDSHTWVASYLWNLWPSTNLVGRLKTERIIGHGNSLYPDDTTAGAPDGIINTTARSVTDSNIYRFGESISFRNTSISRTALYGELEFEQARNWLSEDRLSLAGQSAASANDTFSRETITHIGRGVWTLGARILPTDHLDLTTHVRQRWSNNDYDDTRETDPTGSTARSAFYDELDVDITEYAFRTTLTSWIRVRPSFRYQLRLEDDRSRAENEVAVDSDANSQTVTLDLSYQPSADFLLTTAFSRQLLSVVSPAAASNATTAIPRFTADSNTWLFSVNYFPRPNLTTTTSFLLTHARNFDDFSDRGIPMGADFDRVDLTLGLQWAVNERLTLSPEYGYSLYKANADAEVGDYLAHLFSLEFTLGW